MCMASLLPKQFVVLLHNEQCQCTTYYHKWNDYLSTCVCMCVYTFMGIFPVRPTPILPTPFLPTLGQKWCFGYFKKKEKKKERKHFQQF